MEQNSLKETSMPKFSLKSRDKSQPHIFPFFFISFLVSSNLFKIFYLKNRTSINYKNYMGVLKISSSIIKEVIRYTFDDFLIQRAEPVR